MTPQIVGLLLRHALTAVGLLGVVSDSDLEQIAGALFVLGGLAWSYYQKRHASRPIMVNVDRTGSLR